MEAKTFRTRTGYCHVFPDKLILSRYKDSKNSAGYSEKDTIGWRLLFYGAITIYILYNSATLYRDDQMVRSILHCAVGLLLLYVTIKSLNNSSIGLIRRDTIRETTFQEASGATRAYITVVFEDGKGRIKKRLIMLPGSLSGGREEVKKAKAILAEEGLLN